MKANIKRKRSIITFKLNSEIRKNSHQIVQILDKDFVCNNIHDSPHVRVRLKKQIKKRNKIFQTRYFVLHLFSTRHKRVTAWNRCKCLCFKSCKLKITNRLITVDFWNIRSILGFQTRSYWPTIALHSSPHSAKPVKLNWQQWPQLTQFCLLTHLPPRCY